jgi:hypothetical protein
MPTTTSLPPIHRDQTLRDLRELVNGPRPPLALVGAGASMDSGFPSWADLIDKLSQAAAAQRPLPKWYATLNASNDAAWQAEEYRIALGPQKFADFIKLTFKPAATVAEPHHAIAQLPFRHILTTNYENCCEVALKKVDGGRPPTFRWDQTDELNRFIMGLGHGGVPRHVIYMHGRYNAPESIILTEESYVRRYIETEDARRKLLAIFMTNRVVFIGFSMSDPDLAHLMREVAARVRTEDRPHYAIMGYSTPEEREAISRRMGVKFGVKVAFYHVPENTEDHGNLEVLLRYLKTGRVVGRRSPKPPPTRTLAPAPAHPGPAPRPTVGQSKIDPRKGAFGGKPRRDGLVLRVEDVHEKVKDRWLTYAIVLEDTRSPPKLTGKVRFFLHPTFGEDEFDMPVRKGRVRMAMGSYGAFTLGVETEDGTRLELDLATDPNPDIPRWFRVS